MNSAKFREFLKEKGLKFTREREAILTEVLGRKGHFNPEDLHADLRAKGHVVSRASIYRTLPLLVQFGAIEQVELSERHAQYERTRGHHDHMLCVSCGRVIEFYSEELERLQDSICREKSFSGLSHTLEITGRCSACSRAMRGRADAK